MVGISIVEKCPIKSIKIVDIEKMHLKVKRFRTNGLCQEKDFRADRIKYKILELDQHFLSYLRRLVLSTNCGL